MLFTCWEQKITTFKLATTVISECSCFRHGRPYCGLGVVVIPLFPVRIVHVLVFVASVSLHKLLIWRLVGTNFIIMKKIFLLFTLCCLAFNFNACSSDDDNQDDNDTTKTGINPPDWIIGTWKADLVTLHEFEFTKDNFIFTQLTTVYNFAEIAKQDYYTVKEIVNTNTEYQISKIFDSATGTSATDTFKFIKASEDETTFYMSNVGVNPVAIKLNRIK